MSNILYTISSEHKHSFVLTMLKEKQQLWPSLISVHNMAEHWHCGDVSSNMRGDHSRLPFRLNLEVQNQGLAPGVETPLTFDPADERRSVRATQSWSPVQPILPPVPLRQRRVKQIENHASVSDLEEDEGYFSPFNKGFNGCTKPSRSVFYGSSSSPLLSRCKTRFQPGRSQSGRQERTPLCRQGPVPSGSVRGRVALKVNYGSEQYRQVSMEAQGHTWEPVRGRWTKLVERDSPLHACYEAALPPQLKVTQNFYCSLCTALYSGANFLSLKVKSVVAVPGQLTNPSGHPPQRTFFVDQR